MQYPFYALISRMRYITRWGLMRNTFSENIQEHSHMVAVLAHAPEKIEKADFKLGEDGNVMGFLYLNKDKNIKVNYQGERPYSITMTAATARPLPASTNWHNCCHP